MNERQKGTDQQHVSRDINTITTDNFTDNQSTKGDEAYSICAPAGDKQNDPGLNKSIDNQSTLGNGQKTSVPKSPVTQNKGGKKTENSNTEISTKDNNSVTRNDIDCVEDAVDLADLDVEMNFDKNIPSQDNEIGQGYFEMDCEEIVEGVDYNKDNAYQITVNVDTAVPDAPNIYVIEDEDGEEEGRRETSVVVDGGEEIQDTKLDISKIHPQSDYDKEEKDKKDNDDDKANEEIANEKSHESEDLSNVEIINLESDDETEKGENVKEADDPKTGSFHTENEDIDVKPVSIIGLFTNKTHVDTSDKMNSSEAGKYCNNTTEFCDGYGDGMVNYEDRDMLRNVAAVGLAPRKHNFQDWMSSVEYADKSPQKRIYTEMSEETLVSQQVSYSDEVSIVLC